MSSEPHDQVAWLKERAIVGAAAMVARGFGVRVLSVAALLAVAGILGPEEFGVATFSITGMMLMDLLANASLAAALVRRPEEPRRAELASALALQLLLATALTTLVVAAGLTSGSEIGKTLALTALALPLSIIRSPAIVITERRLEYGPIVAADIVETAVFSVVAVGLAVAGLGPYAVAVGILARKATGSLLLAVKVPEGRMLPHWDFTLVRPILAFGLQFQAASLIDQGRDQILNIGIALVSSVSAVGLWSAAFRFLQLPFIFLQGVWRVAFPAFARLRAEGADVRSTLERAIGTTAVILAGLLATLVALGPDTFTLILGDEWRRAYAVAAVAALGIAVNGPIAVISTGYLWAEGMASRVLAIMVVSAIVWLASGLALLAALGITGVGIGWLISSLCEAALFGYSLSRIAAANVARRVAVPSLCATAAAAGGLGVATAVGSGILGPLAGGAVGIAVYLASMTIVDRDALAVTARLTRRSLQRFRTAA